MHLFKKTTKNHPKTNCLINSLEAVMTVMLDKKWHTVFFFFFLFSRTFHPAVTIILAIKINRLKYGLPLPYRNWGNMIMYIHIQFV
jgi:hypothetical protein